MTDKVFYQDSYQKTHESTVAGKEDSALIFTSTIFYPMGGGQPVIQGASPLVINNLK